MRKDGLIKAIVIMLINVVVFGGAAFGLNFVTGPIIEKNNASAALGALTEVMPEGKDFLEDTVAWVAQSDVEITDEKAKEQFQRLLDMLAEDDDVQDVYHNVVGFDQSEE